jgi:glycosyltransferase involved in cell wall biosynthesis
MKKQILMWTDVITCLCATHIIPEGEGVKNDLKKYGITSKRMEVLGYGNVRGVDMDYYSRRPEVIRKAEQLHGDSRLHEGCQQSSLFIFLFVGRIVRDKGINELCKAYQRIHGEYPETRLWLVGDFEEELDPISDDSKALIRMEGNGIMAVGSKTGDELLAYYVAADCYVFPSYREGFPNTVLEAGAMGLPCIATNINGSREIIAEGVNGTIIPSKDAEALYWAMKRMIDCPERRKEMATKARSMIATRFEQGFVRKCLFDYYDRILPEKSA